MGQQIHSSYTADDQLDFCSEIAAECTDREGLRAWIERERPHLLRSYDAEFLVSAVERARGATQVRR